MAVKSNAFIEQAPESVDKLKFVAALCFFWWRSFLALGAMLDLLKFLQMLHVVLLATEISIFYSLAFTKTLGMLCTAVSWCLKICDIEYIPKKQPPLCADKVTEKMKRLYFHLEDH